MANPETPQQGDESTISAPQNKTSLSNDPTHPPAQTRSALKPTTEAATQQTTPNNQIPPDPPQSQDTSSATSNSQLKDESIQQPQPPSPMSFTCPAHQADQQPQPHLHLRGGCDDEACDCCCCAYTRYGPPPQPMYHRLWYGPPGTG